MKLFLIHFKTLDGYVVKLIDKDYKIRYEKLLNQEDYNRFLKIIHSKTSALLNLQDPQFQIACQFIIKNYKIIDILTLY